jgi:serine O-acetyltransferase
VSLAQSLFLSSGSSVVIGETARLGDDVVVMQGVTLGGNGKERGDRHPKIGQ